MAIGVWPAETQVGTVQGQPSWKLGAELPLTQFLERRAKASLPSFVNSGMAVSAVGGALSVTVATGHCVIGGRYVEIISTETVTGLAASVTQYVFLQLTFTSQKVTGTQWIKQTSTTPPADSVCVARVVTNGTEATAIDNAAQPNRGSYGSTFNGSGTLRLMFLGWQPSIVFVRKISPVDVYQFESGASGLVYHLNPLGFWAQETGADIAPDLKFLALG